MDTFTPARSPAAAQAQADNVIELRQYTLRPGQRDVLIELFERVFVDALEDTGMTVLGQFGDLDRPDRFVWLRGFPDMPQRARSLAAFYGGPIWQVHRDAANATMIDSDDVLLLRPAHASAAMKLAPRAARTDGAATARVVVMISPLARPADAARIALFDTEIARALWAAGARVLGHYVSETRANNYPRLPVREGENVHVALFAFADEAAHAKCQLSLASSPAWLATMTRWNQGLVAAPQMLRLAPTPRSRLRG